MPVACSEFAALMFNEHAVPLGLLRSPMTEGIGSSTSNQSQGRGFFRRQKSPHGDFATAKVHAAADGKEAPQHAPLPYAIACLPMFDGKLGKDDMAYVMGDGAFGQKARRSTNSPLFHALNSPFSHCLVSMFISGSATHDTSSNRDTKACCVAGA